MGSTPIGGTNMKMQRSKVKSQKLLLIVVLAGFFLFSANQVLAAGWCQGPIVPCGSTGQPDCQFCHIFIVVTNILNFILTCLTPIVAGLMLIIGGLYLLASGANPQTFGQAKSIITAVVVGLVIIFIAWVFLNTLLTYMGIQQWTGLGTWWDFTDKCPVR